MKRFFDFVTALIVLPFRPSLSAVLLKVNEARKSLNMPQLASMPSGAEGKSTQCPLAHALGGMVGVDGICFNDPQLALQVASVWNTPIQANGSERYIVTLPDTLRQFVRDFDLGAYRIFA
ncbi:MAG: hypothetical protein AB8G77_14615 [Rhodothermales bacterium]